MIKSFIINVDERNHVQHRKNFNIAANLTELPSEDYLKDAEITRINADPEDQSASEFKLYKIKFANGNVDYYALKIPYNRAARAKVESDRIIISIIDFGEDGFQQDQFDFMINDYNGVECESIEDLKQFMHDVCVDQLDSVFGLLDDCDYNCIFDAIDEWVDKYSEESEIKKINESSEISSIERAYNQIDEGTDLMENVFDALKYLNTCIDEDISDIIVTCRKALSTTELGRRNLQLYLEQSK